jgi:TolA-binding protein
VVPAQTRRPTTSHGTWIQGEDAKWRLQADINPLELEAVQMQLVDLAESAEEAARAQSESGAGAAAAAAAETPRAASARAAMARQGSGAAAAAAAAAAEETPSPPATKSPHPCSICLERPPKIVWQCGHPAACAKCFKKLSGAARKGESIACPICRDKSHPIEVFW